MIFLLRRPLLRPASRQAQLLSPQLCPPPPARRAQSLVPKLCPAPTSRPQLSLVVASSRPPAGRRPAAQSTSAAQTSCFPCSMVLLPVLGGRSRFRLRRARVI